MTRWLVVLLALGLALPAAADELLLWLDDEIEAVSRHGPWPPPPPRDASNRASGNEAARSGGVIIGRSPSFCPIARREKRGKITARLKKIRPLIPE